VEHIDNYAGALVTYCFEVTNTGATVLGNVTIVNPLLNFSSSAIGTLQPSESRIVAFTSKIMSNLTNLATATGNPTYPNGTDIPDAPDVSSSDDSSVGTLQYSPAIKIENTVYVGDDLGVLCASKSVEKVTDLKSTAIVYCFKITNTGDTYLHGIRVDNAELEFFDTSVDRLAPNESTWVIFPSSIAGSLVNNAVVTARPSFVDGRDILGAQPVTATDPSEVAFIYVPTPPSNTTCIENHWQSAGKNGTLLCTNKQVSLSEVASTKKLQCKLGEKIKVSVNGNVLIDGDRNDLGWYVASDGGDALTGTCTVQGLESSYNYSFAKTSNATKPPGRVVWWKKDGADDDQCGDIAGTTGPVELRAPLLVDTEIMCADENEDGIVDVAFCFTWRSDANNKGVCQIADNIPGTSCSCYCTRYDIPDVVIETPSC
jgi:hypothetical protein